MQQLKSIKNTYSSFRVQKRRYSSNIIEGGNYNPENKIEWVPILAPLVKKDKGDKFCLDIFNLLMQEQNGK